LPISEGINHRHHVMGTAHS